MSDNPFRDRLEKLIAKAYGERAEQIATGASTSFDHYRQQVGYLLGLQTALDLCQTAQDELNRDDEE